MHLSTVACVLWIGAATAAEILTARSINLNRAASEERSNCVVSTQSECRRCD